MRYVAFIDTLGFRQKITQITHEKAVDVIRLFNQTIFDLWEEFNLIEDQSIHGRTFSDSIVIHSSGSSLAELDKMLKFIIKLYKLSITTCDLPLRGGLAFGDFDDIKAIEFENLQKGLIVGTAFIEAYLLESSYEIKGSKLLLGEEIKLKIENEFQIYKFQEVKTKINNQVIYELKWGDLEFLMREESHGLRKFIELATESKWLDHYYGTLETFLIGESSENKSMLYSKIIEDIKENYRYSDLDNFIENYLKSESANYTKRSFLSYIRNRL